MAGLKLRGIEKRYGAGPPAVRGVDLDVADGSFTVLVGPSGCGKSTLLRMIAGLEEITAGDLYIGERRVNEVPPAERGAAMVFQSYALYPHMTVAENMGFALRLAGRGRAEIRAAVARAAAALRIEHLLDRRPKELSGGQRQRVAIGRAIVRRPQVFLFDEPLSNLDAGLRVQMRIELARTHQELGATMVYVTHDQVEAMTLGDRIVVMSGGRVEQTGAPLELYERPANRFVAGFLGSPRMNFLPCRVARRDRDGSVLGPAGGAWAVALPSPDAPEGVDLVLGVRPEHLELAPPGHGLPARVELTEHLGDQLVLYASCPGAEQPLAVKLAASGGGPRAGELVGLRPDLARCHLFQADGSALR